MIVGVTGATGKLGRTALRRGASVALLLLLVCVSTQAAQPAFRTRFPRKLGKDQQALVCRRVKTPPKIDGEVDKDPVWRTCGRTRGAWTQLGTKIVSGRQTVVYAGYDDKNLYLGFVCEETQLQRVQMDGSLGNGSQLGSDDFVEAILEIGGMWGDGKVYSFRANSKGRISAWGLTGISIKHGYHVPKWKSAGKFGPNRWMLEMAIPFATLKRRPNEKGLSTPKRGDLLGLKLVRGGAVQPDQKNRMISTWNTNIVYPIAYISGFNGLLYFEDSNALTDGDFKVPVAESAWKRDGASLSQVVTVRPECFYILSLTSDGPSPEILIDGRKQNLKNGKLGFWIDKKQERITLTIRPVAPVKLRNVTMEYQPGEEPPGTYCLTNNYHRTNRNIRSILPKAPDGKYRYVKIDYVGRVVADANPGIPAKTWFRNAGWSHDFRLRVEDLGGVKGWIPFSKGSLTGRPEPIFWQTVNPRKVGKAGHHWARVPQVVEIDLGQEYYVRGLDVLWPAPNTTNFEIWGKVREEDEWVYLYTGNSEFVEPSKRRKHRRSYESVRSLDSVIRYLRWRTPPLHNYTLTYEPLMDGIQEFWVWGEPKGERKGISAFRPWVPTEKVPPVKALTPVPDREGVQIIPRPRHMKKGRGCFVLDKETRIIAQDHPEALKTARQIREEVRDLWNLNLSIEKENLDVPEKNIIYLGQPSISGYAAQLAKQTGLKVDKERPGPQGYGIRITPQRVVVLGRDDKGLYYGVQSLMMAMRWRSDADPARSGPAVRAMKVLDWPGTLERGLWNYHSTLFKVPFHQAYQVKRICKLLSRFKFNVIYLKSRTENPFRKTDEAHAKLCREIREAYHFEIRPMLPIRDCHGGPWEEPVKKHDRWQDVEHDPDESAREIDRSFNVCPLEPKTYELMFDYIDKDLENFGYPSTIRLEGLVGDREGGGLASGARWGRCRRCQRSGKSPEELYAYFLQRIAEHLRKKRTKAVLYSRWVRYGPRRSDDRRPLSVDFRDLPWGFRFDLSKMGRGRSRELIDRWLPAEQRTNAPGTWPCMERYLYSAPHLHDDILRSLGQGGEYRRVGLFEPAEKFWYAPDSCSAREEINVTDLGVYVNSWWYGRDFPSWRYGEEPAFFPLDLHSFANHTSRATGLETLKPGHPPEIDLRYVPKGRQRLSGVLFDIIDPEKNNGKGVLMLGRPPKATLAEVARTVSEKAGPIPVGRKLASLCFLRTRWQCLIGGTSWQQQWLRPTYRVVFEDNTWLVVDSFMSRCNHDDWRRPQENMFIRHGWRGNAPTGNSVGLNVVEWVNPYPDIPIKHIDFFTPGMEDEAGKRVNNFCEAIVAITGVKATEHDIGFWKASHKPPRIKVKERIPASWEELRVEKLSLPKHGKNLWQGTFKIAESQIPYRGELSGNKTELFTYGRFLAIASKNDYKPNPFKVTLTFDNPMTIDRVELLGPKHLYSNISTPGPRTHKVNVSVEISKDGDQWQHAGKLQGFTAQADFLPVFFPKTRIKAIRMTGTADACYYYVTNGENQDYDYGWPHFAWRLFAPEKSRTGRRK